MAVDGNGGQEFRIGWNERYKESKAFRRMIYILSVVWMLVFYATAIGLGAMIWVLGGRGTDAQMVALGVAWAGPFLLGGLLAWGTILYVQRCLKEEKKEEAIGEGERRPLLAD